MIKLWQARPNVHHTTNTNRWVTLLDAACWVIVVALMVLIAVGPYLWL